MRKLHLFKSMLLLCALIAGSTSVWADYEEVYNLNCPKNSKASDYTKTFDVTIDDITWNAPGNQNIDGCWRIGGKSISTAVDRVITGKSAIEEEITKITFNHNGKSRANVAVPSVTLTVASDADFNTVVDEVVVENPDVTKGEANSFDFTPTSPLTEWANCYYKITISVSNSDSSNGGLDVTSIVFYKTVADKTATTTAITTTGITNTDLKNGTTAGSLSASVTAGGSPVAGATVTWKSDDTDVATIAADGTVTLVSVGTTTITATYAGDGSYYGSSDTYDLTVTDTRTATVTTIDDSDLTNTDVYLSVTAGQLTASVTAGGSAVEGATVTWESSNTDVATIDAEGNVTLVKAGTTTITASYVGGGAYGASSDTYELTVTDSNAPLLYESVSLYTSENDSSTKITNDNKTTYLDEPTKWAAASFSNAYPGKNGCFKLGTSSNTGTIVTNTISLTGSGKLTFQAKQYKSGEDGLSVTVTGATASGDVSVTAGSDFAEYTVYLNNATGSVVITFTSTTRIYLDEIKLVKVEKENITVTSYGWASYVAPYPVEFPAGRAYVVTEATVGGTVTTAEVTKVPANTPVLLKNEGTVTATVLAETPSAPESILSVGEATIPAGKYAYVLAKDDTKAGFKQWTGDAETLKGRVVMLLDEAASARAFYAFDDETTGVEELKNGRIEESKSFYNLNGQRVSQPSKGLYIVNGRKVVVK